MAPVTVSGVAANDATDRLAERLLVGAEIARRQDAHALAADRGERLGRQAVAPFDGLAPRQFGLHHLEPRKRADARRQFDAQRLAGQPVVDHAVDQAAVQGALRGVAQHDDRNPRGIARALVDSVLVDPGLEGAGRAKRRIGRFADADDDDVGALGRDALGAGGGGVQGGDGAAAILEAGDQGGAGRSAVVDEDDMRVAAHSIGHDILVSGAGRLSPEALRSG